MKAAANPCPTCGRISDASTIDNHPAHLRLPRDGFNRIGWRILSFSLTAISIIAVCLPFAIGGSEGSRFSGIITICFGAQWVILGFWDVFVLSWQGARKQAIHPGAVVGMDLVIWLYGVASATFGVLALVSESNWIEREHPQYGNWLVSTPAQAQASLVCFAVYTGLTFVVVFMHFGLFVAACVTVDHHRKAVKAAKLGHTDAGHNAVVEQATIDAAVPTETMQSSVRETSTPPRYSNVSVGKQLVFDNDVESLDEKEILHRQKNW